MGKHETLKSFYSEDTAEQRNKTKLALESLKSSVEGKEKRLILDFEDYLEIARKEPRRVFRNIFQLFSDMVTSYVGEGEDEYPNDPESIGFVKYNCSKIFEQRSDNPFFADRLFANRFIGQMRLLKQGSQQNRIYIYEGPQGCGKSTFLNNLLRTFEEYTDTEEGRTFEIFWEIKLDGKEVKVSCPSHENPILLIPKSYRISFLDNLLSPEKLTELDYQLTHEKEYEWLFKNEACTICKSLFRALIDKVGSLDAVLKMVKVRYYKFDRRLGEGISVFNPGDKPMKEAYLTDKQIQEKLDETFGANLVKYVFSRYAKTNNGIYVLTDIKSHNKDRLLELHNVISEGVHKVNGIIEESISSLFIALMNPEDKKSIEDEKVGSLQGRIRYTKISYVLDVPTEVKIYHSIFGDQINSYFLPGVLENFARIIISSRMNSESKPLQEWIPDVKKYKKYCDESGLLLRMEIYSGVIPAWLSEEDKKGLTAKFRRRLIAQGEQEGEGGFSVRDSIRFFGEFVNRYCGKTSLANMRNVSDYFKKVLSREQRNQNIPPKFIDSVVDWYNYTVLSQIKESLYLYDKKQISENILNYLYAINYDVGNKVRCNWTQQDFEVTLELLKTTGSYFVGKELDDRNTLNLARSLQLKYVEVIAQGKESKIVETELYCNLFDSYIRHLKERTFEPFLKNNNFKDIVSSFGTKEFETFDTRLKLHVSHMIKNLIEKFNYTERGAKEICLYAVDQSLVEKFS